jgi:hypothetical protein
VLLVSWWKQLCRSKFNSPPVSLENWLARRNEGLTLNPFISINDSIVLGGRWLKMNWKGTACTEENHENHIHGTWCTSSD